MADTFGALQLPVPEPATKAESFDPFLQYSLSYFQAVVNAKATDAWQKRVKGSAVQQPIHTVHDYDPAELSFVERDLPALYMWRSKGRETEWMASDILVAKTDISVLWIMPAIDQEKQKSRVQFVNDIHKLIASAVELGRDPSWILDGDTDPQAATYGSVYPRWAGISELTLGDWKQKLFVVVDEETKTHYTFHALDLTMHLEEVLTRDIEVLVSGSPLFPVSKVDVTQTTEDGQVVTDHQILT